jgi:hypothetical protein
MAQARELSTKAMAAFDAGDFEIGEIAPGQCIRGFEEEGPQLI